MKPRIAVLIISDRVAASVRQDQSGQAIVAWIAASGRTLVASRVVADDESAIVAQLEEWIEANETDVILTTGGTGFSSRDITPEATWSVIEREAPGIAEAIRAAAQPRVPTAALSRGIAGIAQQTLIVNLPGALSAVTDGITFLDTVLDHAVAILRDETEH